MSLDVYLYGDAEKQSCTCSCGHQHETEHRPEFYWANITHNLNRMAEASGIYKALWRPEEIGATKAKDIAGLLRKGLEAFESGPEKFKQFNSPNGWGSYDNFVPWVRRYLQACELYPEATIEVSR